MIAHLAGGKSAEQWQDAAEYLFQEGYKLAKFAGEQQWIDIGEDAQKSYADLYRKLGAKYGFHPYQEN